MINVSFPSFKKEILPKKILLRCLLPHRIYDRYVMAVKRGLLY